MSIPPESVLMCEAASVQHWMLMAMSKRALSFSDTYGITPQCVEAHFIHNNGTDKVSQI